MSESITLELSARANASESPTAAVHTARAWSYTVQFAAVVYCDNRFTSD